MDQYETALLRRDSKATIECLSKRSIEFFDDMLNIAQNFNDEELGKLDFLINAFIKKIRRDIDRETLRGFKNGEEFLTHLITFDIYRNQLLPVIGISYIDVKDNFASASIHYYQYKMVGFDYHYFYENDAWKFDIPQLFSMYRKLIKFVMQYDDLSQEEAVKIATEGQNSIY